MRTVKSRGRCPVAVLERWHRETITIQFACNAACTCRRAQPCEQIPKLVAAKVVIIDQDKVSFTRNKIVDLRVKRYRRKYVRWGGSALIPRKIKPGK